MARLKKNNLARCFYHVFSRDNPWEDLPKAKKKSYENIVRQCQQNLEILENK